MSGMIADAKVGLMLAPDAVFLDLLHDVIRSELDYCEVTPETLWFETREGALAPNGFHREFLELKNSHEMPFVAHCVGYNMGSLAAEDAHFRERWMQEMKRDQALFGFEWITDHLGATSLAGQLLALPLPTPMTASYAAITRKNLYGLQQINQNVGVENSVFYYLHGEALDEPAYLRQVLSAPGFHLLLDLHNLYTMSENFDFDPLEYLERLPLERVIEIHIAGGQDSNPLWLPGGEVMRLDSHDNEVPEAVWELLEKAAPKCANLRGLTLERMEGTVTAQDVAPVRDELRRAKALLQGRPSSVVVPNSVSSTEVLDSDLPGEEEIGQIHCFEELVANAMRSPDPSQSFAKAASLTTLSDVQCDALRAASGDGVRLSALLVARLRFERLIQSCPEAAHWYDEDPKGFTQEFRRFHQEVSTEQSVGSSEAREFNAWRLIGAQQ